MSRQRTGWGLSRWMEKNGIVSTSLTAGKNKYAPQTANRTGEALRRSLALQRLAEKKMRKARLYEPVD